MQAIIIEDEKPAARRLQRMLAKNGIMVDVLLHSVSQATEWLLNHEQPDLIFLDIQLSDGLSFEIFEEVKIDSAIIFTTAYDEYALKAFKLNSIDYLLKPIDSDELKHAINQFDKQNNASKIDIHQIQKLLNQKSSTVKYKHRFTTKVGSHIKIIPIQEIICFYSLEKASYIKTTDNRDYIIEMSLEELEKILRPSLFFRINRKLIVKIDAIEDIISYSNSRLKLKMVNFAVFEAIVSREKVKDFKFWLEG